MDNQEQVVQALRDLGPISLFSKGVPGIFEIKSARTVCQESNQYIELEVALTLQGCSPEDAVILLQEAFGLNGSFRPTLDQKWRRWAHPEVWTQAKIVLLSNGRTWILGRRDANSVSIGASDQPRLQQIIE